MLKNEVKNYLTAFAAVRMHWVHALIRLPPIIVHWRLGYFLFLVVGLYLPLNFLMTVTITDVFPQFSQDRAIKFIFNNCCLQSYHTL